MNTTDIDDDLPLQGLLVLDLSQGIAGPHCGMILRQQGARVLKVEPPTGDWSRQMGRRRAGHTALSIAFNTGKESVVLDTRQPKDRAALRNLAERADIIIQNYRPGVAARMGVDYAGLAALNPKLVYVSVSGYGPSGPFADLPAIDTTIQAVTGLMGVNQDTSGTPRRINLYLVDMTTGIYAAQNVAAALYRVARGGRGRQIEVSLIQTSTVIQSYLLLDHALFPNEAPKAFAAPTGLFNALDGMIYVGMLNDAMFERLCQVMGFDDWLADPILQKSAGRITRTNELNNRLSETIGTQPVAYWTAAFEKGDILFGHAHQTKDMLTHPQLEHLDWFQPLDIEGVGEVPWQGVPGNGQSQKPPGDAPLLGQHTTSVLEEFGLA